jgi:phosphatidate cytidylyltransferase
MLRTRLWMGAILIVLTGCMLVVDQWLDPAYPFLFIFVVGLGWIALREIILLLGPERKPQIGLSYAALLLMALANWASHQAWMSGRIHSAWEVVVGVYVLLLLAVFLREMQHFTQAGRSLERMALTVWIINYLGLFPSFFVQLRWLADSPAVASTALALAIFVPKSGDIGAYCTGRLFGRRPMTPTLSPKKTWEGAIGGLVFAVGTTIGINRLAAPPLPQQWSIEIMFGVTVGIAGMLGDLAESLLKRDCQRKDASQTVPGFGGVLDVVDSVIFAAPVSYLWLRALA